MPATSRNRRDLEALLEWYVEAGVDEALGDSAIDRFASEPEQEPSAGNRADASPEPVPAAPRPAPRRPAPPPQPALPGAPAPAAGGEAVNAARELAASAESLEALRDLVAGFDGCALAKTAKSLCFSDGNPQSPLMFIGEAPGRDEDIQGKPFVGRAGRLLDRMLAAIGMAREDAYITNIVYWRPPGNRTPTPAEAAICRPFIERQIELAAPRLLVFLGGAAAKQMLNTSEGILRLRGRWHTYQGAGGSYRAMATLHPAYLLRSPAQKRLAWRDFLSLRKSLDQSD